VLFEQAVYQGDYHPCPASYCRNLDVNAVSPTLHTLHVATLTASAIFTVQSKIVLDEHLPYRLNGIGNRTMHNFFDYLFIESG